MYDNNVHCTMYIIHVFYLISRTIMNLTVYSIQCILYESDASYGEDVLILFNVKADIGDGDIFGIDV